MSRKCIPHNILLMEKMLKPQKMVSNGNMNITCYTLTSMVQTILQNNRHNYLLDPIKIVLVHCSSSHLVDSDWKWGKD